MTARASAIDLKFGEPPPGYVAGRGRGATPLAGGVSRDNAAAPEPATDMSDDTFDKFAGYATDRLLAAAPDAEDLAAEAAYASVEARMDERRRTQREERFKEELQKQRAEHATVAQQFAPLKRKLATITAAEWEAIPDIGDKTIKKKKIKMSAPAPQSLLIAAQAANRTERSIDTSLGGSTPIGLMGGSGFFTPLPSSTNASGTRSSTAAVYASGFASSTAPLLSDLGEARGTVLSAKLDKIGDNVSGQTVIDPKNFLTDLNSRPITTDEQIADLKKSRALLRSVTKTNPNQATGWIAAARLEELAGQMDAARDLIARGCLQCPASEEIWIEAARLERPDNRVAVLTTATKRIPSSVKLWQELVSHTPDLSTKKALLREALTHVPNSVRLWKEAITLESADSSDARLLLYGAIRQIPSNVDFRLALAKLCERKEAQAVLNEARRAIPSSFRIWYAAAELEERRGDKGMVGRLIRSGLAALSKRGITIDREEILAKAQEAEADQLLQTCEALAAAALPLGVAQTSNSAAWIADARGAALRDRPYTARCLYQEALRQLPKDPALWASYLEFETGAVTLPNRRAALEKAIEEAISALPTNERVWLLAVAATEAIAGQDAARALLERGLRATFTKELVLQAVRMDTEDGRLSQARELLNKACLQLLPSCEALWLEALKHARYCNEKEATLKFLAQALLKVPESSAVTALAAEIYAEVDGDQGEALALQILEKAREKHPTDASLWVNAARILMNKGRWVQARVLLEKSRLKIPRNEDICFAAIELELGAAGLPREDLFSRRLSLEVPRGAAGAAAITALSRASRELPRCGRIWTLAVAMEAGADQNRKMVDALTYGENDVAVVLTTGRLFQQNRKKIKARAWYKRAAALDRKFADAWLFWLLFEAEAGDNHVEAVAAAALLAKPDKGHYWDFYTGKLKLALKPSHVKLLAVADALKPGFSQSLDPDVLALFQPVRTTEAVAALRLKAGNLCSSTS